MPYAVVSDQTSLDRKAKIPAGILGGVAAGIAMAVVAMLVSAAMGQSLFTPVYLISGVFLGASALAGGIGPFLVGLLVHLFVSSVFGVIFAMMTPRVLSQGKTLTRGLIYGVVLWAIMTYAVLPWANPVMFNQVAQIPGWFLFQHLVFGGTLVLIPRLEKNFTQRSRFEEETKPSFRRAA